MKEALRTLACPGCGAVARHESDRVVCAGCGAIYQVVRGIPIMMPASHAVVLEPAVRPGCVKLAQAQIRHCSASGAEVLDRNVPQHAFCPSSPLT